MKTALAYPFVLLGAWTAIFRMVPEIDVMVRTLINGVSP